VSATSKGHISVSSVGNSSWKRHASLSPSGISSSSCAFLSPKGGENSKNRHTSPSMVRAS
jgi:hypothetical protein